MKGIPIDKVDPHASWAVNPPEDDGVGYFCTCGHSEADHKDGYCDDDCECGGVYEPNTDNPVEPPERDPDAMPGGADDY